MTIHNRLKELAKERLIKEGYAPNKIRFECRITTPSGKHYVIDVAASKDKKIDTVIECGLVSPSKLAGLKTLFPRVIHIPYEGYEEKLVTQDFLIKELTEEGNKLRSEVKSLNAQGIYNKGLLIQIPDPVIQTDPALIRLFIGGEKDAVK